MSEQQPPWQLTLDAVAHFPRPGTIVPGNLAFSPDGRLLTYLFSERGDLVRDLWAMDVRTGERRVLVSASPTSGTITREEELRRERLRLREGGISFYRWAEHADRLLLLVAGQLSITSSAGEDPRALAVADAPVEDARLTPDGGHAVFVRAHELWAASCESGESWQLTSGATDTVANGVAEFIAQEEMGRGEGFWISPDSRLVAYEQFDEGHIPLYPIVHQGTADWSVESHRYPFAGGENARVRLGVVPLAGGETRWLDLGPDPDIYLARVDWAPDGRLAVQIESRDQLRLDLRLYDVGSGERTLLLTERSDVWVNLHRDLHFLQDGRFIWSSERSGYRHVYVHAPDGAPIRQLTDGEWPVDAVVHLDEADGRVYFVAGRESPTERRLYSVSLDGGPIVSHAEEPGFHSAIFARSGSTYGHSYESVGRPPTIDVRTTRSDDIRSVHVGPTAEACTPGLSAPELVELRTRDGTRVHGAIYRPSNGARPFPTIVSVYGGPHAQMVTDTWGQTVDLRAQYLAGLGFLVFKLDNRGSARRGLAFEGAFRHHMGSLEVQDQVDGIRWLVERGLADPSRVGIYGWSYGGYMTAMCLLTAPDIFRVGVAGAPVTDWDGYDTHYTERYMGTPTTNPDGYRASSALTHVSGLRGRLLLVHGMIDENVHFRHTARLITAFEAAGSPCDLLILPAERHMPRDEAGRRYVEERVAQYFIEYL